MSIFVKSNQEVKVSIFVSADMKGRMVAYADGIVLPDDLKVQYTPKRYEIVFRYPNYKDTLEITDTGVLMTNNGDISVNAQEMRFKRISSLVKSWSFLDDEGNPVACNVENVCLLDPVVAGAITYGLERALGLVPD